MQSAADCPRCGTALLPAQINTLVPERCHACNGTVFAVVFPALLRPVDTGRRAEAVLQEGEASCFYHPGKQAAASCANCGRFLCTLCDIELAGEHLCARCIEAGKKKGKLKNLQNRRVLYDDIALSLSVLSFLLCYLVFIGAPVALYIAIRHWNSPGSLLPRTKVRYVAAIVISVAEILAGAVFLYWIFSGRGM
jgi:hypothetical protein